MHIAQWCGSKIRWQDILAFQFEYSLNLHDI